MPSVDVYMVHFSPPCRAVLLTAAGVGVDVNIKSCNPIAGETRTPEYLKMNPCHTIPTLDDNGLYLGESRGICAYLANKYGADDSLYPKDPARRAIVDCRLFFDMSLWNACTSYFVPVVFGNATSFNADAKAKVEENLGFLETFLSTGGPYAAGDQLTIADHTLIASVTAIMAIGHFTTEKFPKIAAWIDLCKSQMKGYETASQVGLDQFQGFIQGKISEKLKQ